MRTANAGFALRLLAIFNESFLFIPHALFWFYISLSENLTQFGFRIFVYLIAVVFPLSILGFLYSSLMTYYFGGNIGKLLTGLKVVGENDQKLSLKRIIFRQTIGYQFSWILFGLGYFSVIKDPNKQAWHDKAVGSKVVIQRTWWPLALLTLIIFTFINVYLVTLTVNEFKKGRLSEEFSSFSMSLSEETESIGIPTEPPLNTL